MNIVDSDRIITIYVPLFLGSSVISYMSQLLEVNLDLNLYPSVVQDSVKFRTVKWVRGETYVNELTSSKGTVTTAQSNLTPPQPLLCQTVL